MMIQTELLSNTLRERRVTVGDSVGDSVGDGNNRVGQDNIAKFLIQSEMSQWAVFLHFQSQVQFRYWPPWFLLLPPPRPPPRLLFPPRPRLLPRLSRLFSRFR